MYINEIFNPLPAINNGVDFHSCYTLIGHHSNTLHSFNGFDRRVFVRNEIEFHLTNTTAGVIAFLAFDYCIVILL